MAVLILVVVIILFYFLIKGFLKQPAGSAHKSFNEQDAIFLIALLTRIAKIDGVVDKKEALYISKIIEECVIDLKNPKLKERLKQVFDEQRQAKGGIFELAKNYKQSRYLTKEECESVIFYLLHLAYANGILENSEKEAIKEVARAFELGDISGIFASFEREFSNFSSEHEKSSSYSQKDPYEVLGLSKNASKDEIKKRYKELARKYHPDFLGTKADPDEIARATKKLQEINEAYEILKEKVV